MVIGACVLSEDRHTGEPEELGTAVSHQSGPEGGTK